MVDPANTPPPKRATPAYRAGREQRIRDHFRTCQRCRQAMSTKACCQAGRALLQDA